MEDYTEEELSDFNTLEALARPIFKMLAFKLLEKRILHAYKEKHALQMQQSLLMELEQEEKRSLERKEKEKEKKAKRKERERERKRAKQQQQPK